MWVLSSEYGVPEYLYTPYSGTPDQAQPLRQMYIVKQYLQIP